MNYSSEKKSARIKSGFTLIEILVVIGIIAILATVVLIAINPARQFAQARNSQRVSNVNTLLNAIGQRIADNKGLFRLSTDPTCTVDLPTTTINMGTSSAAILYDIRPCLVPTYLSEIPIDPTVGVFTSAAAYDTGYTVQRDANSGRITVTAPTSFSNASELNASTTATR